MSQDSVNKYLQLLELYNHLSSDSAQEEIDCLEQYIDEIYCLEQYIDEIWQSLSDLEKSEIESTLQVKE